MEHKIRETTIIKLLAVLIRLQDLLHHTDHIKLGIFCQENKISGSIGKILREKGVIASHGKSPGGAFLYRWNTRNPDRQMAIALIKENNERANNSTIKRNALKFTEQLKQRDKEEQQLKEKAQFDVNTYNPDVKEVIVEENDTIVADVKFSNKKTYKSTSIITEVTKYFFSWLKVTRTVTTTTTSVS